MTKQTSMTANQATANKFTPGRLTVAQYGDETTVNGHYSIKDGARTLARLPLAYEVQGKGSPQEFAHLFASAPELLAALELLTYGSEQAVSNGLVQPQVNGGLVLARAALAKVKGQP